MKEIDIQMHDINTLKTSTDFNYQKKQSMTEQLKKLSQEASSIIDGVAKGNFSSEEKRYLGNFWIYS
jgi:hypothetical protein